MSQERNVFGRQPAHVLVVDMQRRLPDEVQRSLAGGLRRFLSLACSLTGPSRFPFFGLVALTSYPEVLFPLQTVRGNYPRLQTAVHELTLMTAGCSSTRSVPQGVVGECLKDVVNMFTGQAQALLQTAGYLSQLEVTIVTAHHANNLVKQVEISLKQLEMESLKKVQVVQLVNADRRPDDMLPSNSQGSTSSQASAGDPSAMVDFLILDDSEASVLQLLMGWLHDVDTESEHLHLRLPSNDGPLLLKCDLQERMISPDLLPLPAPFHVSVTPLPVTPGGGGRSRPGAPVPVHTLTATSRLPADSVCDSVIFGTPLLVTPTTCWKADWDELDANQQRFTALCRALRVKNEVLLAQLTPPAAPTPRPRVGGLSRSHPPAPIPALTPHYLLLPSPRACLLLKPVAVQELLLPVELGASTDEVVGEEATKDVDEALGGLEVVDSFNPLLLESGLHDTLMHGLQRPHAALHGKQHHGQVPQLAAGSGPFSTASSFLRAGKARPPPPPAHTSGTDFYGKRPRFPTQL